MHHLPGGVQNVNEPGTVSAPTTWSEQEPEHLVLPPVQHFAEGQFFLDYKWNNFLFAKGIRMKSLYQLLNAALIASVVWTAQAEEKLNVAVSIEPQAFLVEQIGGSRAHVTVMIPPGASPHTYEPTPGQLRALSKADLYIEVGSGIEFEEQWMNKLSDLNRDMRVVQSAAGIELLLMSDHSRDGKIHEPGQHDSHHEEHESDEEHHLDEHHHKEHGAHDDHHHKGTDPHVWLAPSNSAVMAANIRDALIEADPAGASLYERNAEELISELYALKADVTAMLSGLENRTFIVFHPAWGYFAKEFGLEQVAVEQMGSEPSPRQLAGLIDHARETGSRVVFASPQFSTRSARTIAREIGGSVELIDPLSRDYINNLRRAAEAFAAAGSSQAGTK
jgi:zinc transport system substrate-binding protein